MKPRTRLPSRTTPLARSGIKRSGKPIPRSPVKRKRRKPSEMTRIYGEPARRKWLKSKPCVACVLLLPILASADMEWHCDLAHVGTGGMGRKSDASQTVPMCRKHHQMFDDHVGFLEIPTVRSLIIGAAAAYELSWSTRSE